MIPSLMAARVTLQQSLDFAPDCARVTAPTLVVTGEDGLDRVVPADVTRRYATLIPGARYVKIERTGHIGLLTRPAIRGIVAASETVRSNGESTIAGLPLARLGLLTLELGLVET